MNFEGIKIITSTIAALKHRAAFALPGIGIFVNPLDVKNTNLLRHEFGHILQAKKWGMWFFYKSIAPASLLSARKNGINGFCHQDTWTEWSANVLSYNYFNQPADWDFNQFPLAPGSNRTGTQLPKGINISL